MKLIELFAGIGTQYAAFKDYIDTEVVAISEIDDRPLKIYKKLFGEVNNLGDITKIERLPKADIWTYSFPCTDISIAGKQAGLSGNKSSLLYEIYRLLLSSPKPKILIMENVSNLVSEKFIKGFEEWNSSLKELGYDTTWKKIKACDFGGGTIRNRVFSISVLNEKPFVFPKPIKNNKVVKDYLEPVEEKNYVGEAILDNSSLNYNNSIKLCDFGRGGQGNRIYSINGQGVTLTASGGGKAGSGGGLYARKEGIYKLSSIEQAKLMGWSKDEAILMKEVATDREIGFVLGNAIDLNVFKHVTKAIVEQYFNN